MAYWLMKSNPKFFGIDDLHRLETDSWDGVRNYRARNFMRDEMQVGDKVFFYHSSAKPSGVAGIMTVSKAGYPEDAKHWYAIMDMAETLNLLSAQPVVKS